MRTMLVAACATATLLLPTSAFASAHTSCNNDKLLTSYSAQYHAVAKQFGWRAPGRNIRKWGLSRTRPSQCRHLNKSLSTLRRMRFHGNYMLTPGQPTLPPAGTMTLHAGGTLASIAQCESGGNPAAVSRSGRYRGKYQFDYGTWGTVGGSGDPAAASEAEQDMRAAMLYARRGSQPWPVCGR